jgi:hypothetical protein
VQRLLMTTYGGGLRVSLLRRLQAGLGGWPVLAAAVASIILEHALVSYLI